MREEPVILAKGRKMDTFLGFTEKKLTKQYIFSLLTAIFMLGMLALRFFDPPNTDGFGNDGSAIIAVGAALFLSIAHASQKDKIILDMAQRIKKLEKSIVTDDSEVTE